MLIFITALLNATVIRFDDLEHTSKTGITSSRDKVVYRMSSRINDNTFKGLGKIIR